MAPQFPGPDDLTACKSVMLELSVCFSGFWRNCVIIGGWVPYLVLQTRGQDAAAGRHCGSLDIDLLIDVQRVGREGHAASMEAMRARGFMPGQWEYELVRTVGEPVLRYERPVRVHLMAPAGADADQQPRRRVPGGLQTVVADYVQVALEHAFDYELQGVLPSGEPHSARIRVADEVACFAMKGNAFPRAGSVEASRKDAYDLYMLLRYHRGWPVAVAALARPFLHLSAARAAVDRRRVHFGGPASRGVREAVAFLADSEPPESPDAIEVLRNDVLATFADFFRALD